MTAVDDGAASAPGERIELLRQMIRIRRFEERCVELYSAEAIRGFLHLSIGEEAVAAGLLGVLEPGDAVVSTYREHGHALARGVPMNAVMAEMYGRATGCSHGRGGSMHLFDGERRFYGGNAIVGGGLPLAVGLALADSLRGRNTVTVCLFGDGAVAEGEFHECLNLAALWRLPVLFACENNRYAMGTALKREHAVTDLSLRAAGYGLASWPVDGMDAVEVAAAARRALESIRGGRGPCFLELRTYRFRAHSMYDADRYRDKAEIEQWKARDPIPRLFAELRAAGAAGPDAQVKLEAEVDAEIEAAVAAAESAPLEPITDLTRHVYAETR
ncbi:pyruvate dehydrogenase (acetyl-transferring) E1 component subunit alpha [Nocardia tengchongensis]|uniref:Pyruvate dehydrogenase E1 component subunit alpha n=1 Tax=Nocardia tengchongensis TaxID=2055889 RepID=A0ABX8CLL2_9NOCA|nr:pyruvate dehydrogenase (acetyl-transferring) E1 component subunit alpha [Nocardia tengchongensis]QVI19395.1 pyruvate dehydrogenase (acetyl-transferring) E1 component subunit alpha [Nocardia tengchongensis]